MTIHPKFSGAGIGGLAMTKAFQGIICAAVVAFVGAAPVMAQQAESAPPPVGQTPPELRDFRLDPPPTPQGPEQRPAPREERPPAPAPAESPVTAPAPAPSSPEPSRAVPTPRTTFPPDRRTRDESAEASRSQAGTPIAPPLSDAPRNAASVPATPLPQPASANPAAAPANQAASGAPSVWPWLALLIALLTGSGAFFLWRRRAQASALPPAMPAMPAAIPPTMPGKIARPPAPQAARMAPAGPTLTATFNAESAQLSIASLTVTGTLSIANQGAEPIPAVQLRSLMISAQEGQEEAAAAFHAGESAGDAQMIGDLAPGERIDARIEFRLPREELASFRWSEREFVAPILLINVRSGDASSVQEVRLSQLIGRAPGEQAARLKPLAIDRGPRRFQPIAARPVFG